MKKATSFFCKECGYESPKWLGQCPACKAWNSMVEEPSAPKGRKGSAPGERKPEVSRPRYLREIDQEEKGRISTSYGELDRVLGGGIVEGSLILVGGDPGIGKSTLLLQVCLHLANAGQKVLYVSGEESLRQIKMRADRIGGTDGELKFFCDTDIDGICRVIGSERPDVTVIDSIQTMCCEEISGAPGSVSQVREATGILMQTAKTEGVAIWIVGHVTKDGQVAGPRMLEHMVDTVLYFEGERNNAYRVLRAVKNRFGSTNEIGVFEMQERGLVEVPNPSEFMLSGRPEGASGAIATCLVEGTRPILLEVQALVTKTAFGIPRRTAAGTDGNRVNLLMAVLESRCHFPMSQYDAYINIAGGVKMNEPALDLALVMAIVSSLKDSPVDDKTVIFGEVGLSGEVRAVSQAENRIREAAKLGFTRAIVPKTVASKCKKMDNMEIVGISTIQEGIQKLWKATRN